MAFEIVIDVLGEYMVNRYIEEDGVTEVVIPDGVKRINWDAFSGCKNLTNIIIPEGVIDIGMHAFNNCSSLTSITIPESVTYINLGTFSNCSSLASITIPKSVTHIGGYAFRNCSSLASITIPESVTSIGKYAFEGCTNLKKVLISEGVESIGAYAFCQYENFTDITIPESVIHFGYKVFKNLEKLADKNGFVIINNIFCMCVNTDITEAVIPEGITVIGDNAFDHCCKLASIVLPDSMISIGKEAFKGCCQLTDITIPNSVKSIGDDAFFDCSLLKKVTFGMSLPEFSANIFASSVKFLLPSGFAKNPENLSATIMKHLDVNDISAEDKAYILAFGSKAWGTFLANATSADNGFIMKAIELLGSEKKKIAEIAALLQYVNLMVDQLSHSDVSAVFEYLKNANPTGAKKFESNPQVQAKLSTEPVQEHEIEKYVCQQIEKRPINIGILNAVKKGIPYADGSGVSSRNAVAFVLNEYAELYARNKMETEGEMSSVEVLKDGSCLTPCEEADHVAAQLDKKELVQLLRDKYTGTKYRSYILAYVRYGSEEDIRSYVTQMNSWRRGRARERYWADNAEEALYLSDTFAAAKYFEGTGGFAAYAKMRGMTEDEYRIKNLLPDFGMNESCKLTYDVGGNTVEVTLTADLKFSFYDVNSKKTAKSFPKKSGEAEKVKACIAEFNAIKKDIAEFIKTYTTKVMQMHTSGKSISKELWKAEFLSHPIIRKIAGLLVWKDDSGKHFVVSEDAKMLDINDVPYEPSEKIGLAHVLDMTTDEVMEWQKYLSNKKQKQLFVQMWEPTLVTEELFASISNRYEGAVLTNKDRTAFRAKMKNKGIDVRSDEMIAEFDYDAYQYVYATENDMRIDDCITLHYFIDNDTKNITLGKLTVHGKSAKKVVNAVVSELDMITLHHQIEEDRDDVLMDDRLNTLSLMQVSELIELSTKSKAAKCSARLLDYKNSHFADFDPMDEFTLE